MLLGVHVHICRTAVKAWIVSIFFFSWKMDLKGPVDLVPIVRQLPQEGTLNTHVYLLLKILWGRVGVIQVWMLKNRSWFLDTVFRDIWKALGNCSASPPSTGPEGFRFLTCLKSDLTMTSRYIRCSAPFQMTLNAYVKAVTETLHLRIGFIFKLDT